MKAYSTEMPCKLVMLAIGTIALAIPGTDIARASAVEVILNETSYCRSYHQFGWDRVDGKVLKEQGEKLLGKRSMQRLEKDTKRRLKYKKIDWSKVDWRDHAVMRWITLSHRTSKSEDLERACRTDAPPSQWSGVDFDDSTWGRFKLPFAVGPYTSMYHSQWSAPSPGLQAAFFRYRFEVPDPAKAGDLSLRAEYIGGIRVFLNGKEITRRHLPDGEITADTISVGYPREAYYRLFEEQSARDLARAKKKLRGKAPPKWYGFAGWYVKPGSRLYKARNRTLAPVAIPKNLLRKGGNVLAIEIRAAPLYPPVVYNGQWIHGSGVSRAWLHATLSKFELRSAAGALQSAVKRPAGVQVWTEDPHRRLYTKEYLEPGAGPGTIRIVGARNGAYGAQVVVGTDKEVGKVKFTFGDLKGAKGSMVPAASLQAFGMGRHSPRAAFAAMGEGRIGGNNFFTLPGYRSLPEFAASLRHRPQGKGKNGAGDFHFFDQITRSIPEKIAADSCQPFWVRLQIPRDTKPGTYRGAVSVEVPGARPVSIPVETEVVDWTLPDAKHLQTLMAVEQSPYGVAKAYKTPLWSEEHFKYLEESMKEIGRVGNDWWYVPVIHYTEFGNGGDSMIKWFREADGTLSFDYKIMDRYLDLAINHCGRPRVVSFVVMHGAPGTVEVKVHDKKTGKDEAVSLGGAKYDPVIRQRYWSAFAKSLYAHMKSRGLQDTMHWGYAWDTEGDPKIKELLRASVPDVFWTFGAHSRGAAGSGGRMSRESVKFYKSISLIYGLVPGLKSRMGWKRPDAFLLNPRMISSCSSTEGHAPPYNYRLMVDRALVASHNGMGRVGGDFWNGSYYAGARVRAWHQASFSILTVLWPGANGAEPSARYEAMLEGMQEAESRIFIEQAIDRKLLPEDLAERAQGILNEHNRETLYIPVHVTAHQLTESALGWLERSRRLYRVAAEVGAAVGLDVDRRELKADVAPLGDAEFRIKLRNWTAKPRAWKVETADAWIVPEVAEGKLSGVQELKVRLDGKKLKPNSTMDGTLTVTDLASGRKHAVKVSATVNAMFEIPTKSLLINAATGKDTVFEGLTLINKSGAELAWSVESPHPWLKVEPAGGKVGAGQPQAFKLIATPSEKTHAKHDAALKVKVGEASETINVTTYVIPPYEAPALPKGTPIWLLDAARQKVLATVGHTMGGYCHAAEKKKPREKRKREDGWWQKSPMYYGNGLPGAFPNVHGPDRSKLPFRMGGKTHLRGIWAYPYHETSYAFKQPGLTAFSVVVGFNDRMLKSKSASRSIHLNFEIHVDGKLRTQSGLMHLGDKPRLLVVDGLEGAKEMKLVMRREDGVNDLSLLGTWADPTFYGPNPPEVAVDLYKQEKQIYADPPTQTIQDWAFLGAFNAAKPCKPYWIELKKEPYLGSKPLDFSGTWKGKSGEIKWRKVTANDKGIVDLDKLLGHDPIKTACYAAVVLESPKDQAIQLGIGACRPHHWNNFMLFLNGRTCHGNSATGVSPNRNRIVLPVKQGKNTLIIRINEAHEPRSKSASGFVVTYRGEGLKLSMPEGVK